VNHSLWQENLVQARNMEGKGNKSTKGKISGFRPERSERELGIGVSGGRRIRDKTGKKDRRRHAGKGRLSPHSCNSRGGGVARNRLAPREKNRRYRLATRSCKMGPEKECIYVKSTKPWKILSEREKDISAKSRRDYLLQEKLIGKGGGENTGGRRRHLRV